MVGPRHALSDLRQDVDGFSLTELLVAMVVGSVILTAVMTLGVSGMKAAGKVTDRVEATQRGRIALDRMTSLLQAQVCAAGAVPLTDAQANAVTFTANIGDVQAKPVRYQLRYDPTARGLYEDRYVPTALADGSLVFPAAPTQSRLLAANVLPVDGAIFRYFAFDSSTRSVSANPLPAPLSAAGRQLVVRVGLALVVVPERLKGDAPTHATLYGQAIVGGFDPQWPDRGLKC